MNLEESSVRHRSFEEKMSNWVAAQGLFFQLRHAGMTARSSALRGVLALSGRLALVGLILLGAGFFAGRWWMKSDDFRVRAEKRIENGLALQGLEASGFVQEFGKVSFRELKMEGGAETPFFKGTASLFSAGMPLGSLARGVWDAGEIHVGELRVDLKAGGEEKMKGVYESLFEPMNRLRFETLVVNSATLEWGYTKSTYGSVRGSRLRAVRKDGSWRVTLQGGYFEQNWLRNLEIISAEVVLSPEGVQIVSAEFRQGKSGIFTMRGKVGGTAVEPEFELKLDFEKAEVANLVDVRSVDLGDYIEGRLGGSLVIRGSTRDQIKTEGRVELNPNQSLVLRDGWPILRAVALIDTDQGYRRLDFGDGRFRFQTGGGEMTVSELDIRAEDEARLTGEFATALPSQNEAAEALGIKLTIGMKGALDVSEAGRLESERVSLTRPRGDGGQAIAGFAQPEKEGSGLSVDELRLREEMTNPLVSGALKLGLPLDSFAKNPKLAKTFELSPDGSWRWIPLTLNDRIGRLTRDEATSLMKRGRRNFEGAEVGVEEED